jgi:hypothetical protein
MSESTELAKNVLSADIKYSRVQADFRYIPHVVRMSYTFDNVLYFGRTGESDYSCCLGFLKLPIVIVVVVIESKWLQLRINSGENCPYSHG